MAWVWFVPRESGTGVFHPMRNTRPIVLAAAGVSFLILSRSSHAAVAADAVVSYAPGDFSLSGTSTAFNQSSAALGVLAGDTGFGGLNPFNPPFSPSQVVAVGAGGQLTLHLSSPVSTAGGPSVGVFANNGIIDVSTSGSGQAGTPAQTFSDAPEAVVSVSLDGVTYIPLNGGNPITFANPTNDYLDQEISGYYEPTGSVLANQFKPFTGTLASFNGETYDQMKATLAGSAGGTWLDLSGTGLPAVSDVRFAVPAGVDYRMVVDSVSAVPEPTVGASLLAGAALLRRRRRAGAR